MDYFAGLDVSLEETAICKCVRSLGVAAQHQSFRQTSAQPGLHGVGSPGGRRPRLTRDTNDLPPDFQA